MNAHRIQRSSVVGVVAALAVVSPFLGIPRLTTDLMTTVCIFGIAATGLNLMFGYAGMLSLGNAVFLGVGGYSVAIASQDWHWPVGAGIALAVVMSAASAAVLGVLLVRLSSHYFAVATLGLSLAFDALLVAVPGTGGGTGLLTVPRLDLGVVVLEGNFRWYLASLVVTAVVVVAFAWFVAGKRGRILRLVRHDELAAEVLGVPVFRAKLLAFVLGAVLCGVAGVLLYLFQGLVNPDSVGTIVSVQLAMLVVIGGPGLRVGGFVGAFTVLFLQGLLNGFGNYELLIYGAALLAVVFYMRPGVEGTLVAGWGRLAARLWSAGAHETPTGSVAVGVGPGAGAPTRLARGEHADPARAGRGTGLVVRGARRAFGGVVAVDDVSIEVPSGSVTGLIGANGAGKSTLINLISGVERLDGGAVLLDGVDVSARSPAERTQLGLARTFQVPRLVDELSVVENLVLGSEAAERPILRRRRSAERERFEEARATLVGVGLETLADRPAGSLGTGERKYAEVARAVFAGASTLLLDEPAVGLSPEEIEQLQQWLEAMRGEGAALLVVDHNMDFIKEVASHVYSMESGRIVWQGRPEDIETSSFELQGSEGGMRFFGEADLLA